MKKQLVVPGFQNEAEEAAFWAKLDLSEYFEPSDFKRGVVFLDVWTKCEGSQNARPDVMMRGEIGQKAFALTSDRPGRVKSQKTQEIYSHGLYHIAELSSADVWVLEASW